MKNNNAGMSLIEIIVVVAMLTILTGTGIYGIGQLSGFRAREGADKVTSSLSQARIKVLGKAKSNTDMAWEIYRNGNNYYVRTVSNLDAAAPEYTDEQKIVDGKVTVYTGYNGASGTSLSELTDGANFRIYYNRSTGSLWNEATGATLTENPVVRVKQGTKDYDVEVIAKTGKIVSQTIKK